MLDVKNLSKQYNSFLLDNVSINLEPGYIMGFIGANGAGKTTTIKGILNLNSPNSGEVKIFGKDFRTHEQEIKQEIGFVLGDTKFYERKKLSVITDVVKRFYTHWDDKEYQSLMKRFDLDETKRLKELSTGMKIKFLLTLALSYHAKLLILDEPTSGLDPVARDNLLELFQEIVEDGDKSILFSTHITSDLEKCADYITYINNGKIVDSLPKDEMIDKYKLLSFGEETFIRLKDELISWKKNSFGYTGLIESKKLTEELDLQVGNPTLDDIMIYYSNHKKEKILC